MLHGAFRARADVQREVRLRTPGECQLEFLTGSSENAQTPLIFSLRRQPTLWTARDTRHIERRSRHVSSSPLAHHLFRAPLSRSLVIPREGRNISFHTRPSRVLQQTPGTPRRALLFACCTEIGGHVANPAWSAGARESGSIASARGDNRGAPVATHETTWGVHSRLGCSGP